MIFFISGTGWRSRQTQTQTNIQTDINRILVELTLRCSLGGMFYLALPGFTIHSILYFYFSQVVRSKVKEHPGRGREPLSEPCSALPLCWLVECQTLDPGRGKASWEPLGEPCTILIVPLCLCAFCDSTDTTVWWELGVKSSTPGSSGFTSVLIIQHKIKRGGGVWATAPTYFQNNWIYGI